VTLGRPRARFYIPTVKTPATQPEILSRQEVARLVQAVPNRKHRALLMTTYAAGLRVSEVVRLKVSDVVELLIRVTTLAAVVVPTVMAPNESDVGEKFSGVTPLPESPIS